MLNISAATTVKRSHVLRKSEDETDFSTTYIGMDPQYNCEYMIVLKFSCILVKGGNWHLKPLFYVKRKVPKYR